MKRSIGPGSDLPPARRRLSDQGWIRWAVPLGVGVIVGFGIGMLFSRIPNLEAEWVEAIGTVVGSGAAIGAGIFAYLAFQFERQVRDEEAERLRREVERAEKAELVERLRHARLVTAKIVDVQGSQTLESGRKVAKGVGFAVDNQALWEVSKVRFRVPGIIDWTEAHRRVEPGSSLLNSIDLDEFEFEFAQGDLNRNLEFEYALDGLRWRRKGSDEPIPVRSSEVEPSRNPWAV